MGRVLHGVEVVQVAEELIEAMDRRQELVEVAQVVLAELPGGVTHRLECGGDGHRLCRDADRRTGLAHCGQPGADGQLASDEVGATGRATRFRIIVGEAHPFRG